MIHEKTSVMVVDDEIMSLKVAKRVFDKAGIEGRYFSSGTDAFAFLDGEHIPDVILLDVHMPDINGFDILKQLKASPAYRNVPVVFLTGDGDVRTETEGLHAGAADFVRKPFAAEVLLKRVRNIMELNRLHESMSHEIRVKTEKLSHAYLQIVQALAASVDAKDRYTHGHSARVAQYAKEIAMRAGFSEREQEKIYMMGLLHDVGKIGIRDAIINKTSRLTEEEFAEIKTHPAVGAQILAKITDLPELEIGAHWHHERYDGRGYPDGLKGENIPEVARIIAVADTYDAMTSNRSYRRQLSQAAVRAEIEQCKGSQFDPRFADIMLDIMDEDKDYAMREV
ncbi:MAG: response regulator [Clostridia bacterium]|nr:response regulator [Clostridia bacterium]